MANTTGKKFGGRQKGTPNKKNQEFSDKYDAFAKQYSDPVEILFAMASDEEAERTVRRAAASDLLQYRFAKLRAIEHSGEIATNDPSQLTDGQLTDIATSGRTGATKQESGEKVTH